MLRYLSQKSLKDLCSVIEADCKGIRCAVSIDTYKAGVAEAAIKAGAHIINDVWGANREPEIANDGGAIRRANHTHA